MTADRQPSAELLPCPFCGGDATLMNFVLEATVHCKNCRAAITRTHHAEFDSGLFAVVTAWNIRELDATRKPPHALGRPQADEAVRALDRGQLWLLMRSVLEQGRSIEMDNVAGRYPRYEMLSARIDVAARERADELMAALTAATGAIEPPQSSGQAHTKGEG